MCLFVWSVLGLENLDRRTVRNNTEPTQLQHLTAVTASIHNYLLAYIYNILEDAIRSSTTKHQMRG